MKQILDKTLNDIGVINKVLSVLICIGLGVSLIFLIGPFFIHSGFYNIELDGVVEQINVGSLLFKDRVVLILISSLSLIFWIIGLLSLWKLTRAFKRGDIFLLRNIQYIQVFSLSLLGMAMGDAIEDLLAGNYLVQRGILTSGGEFDIFEAFEQMDYIISALLIWLVCQALRKAVELSEESALTV